MESASQEVAVSQGNDSRKAKEFIENIGKGKTRRGNASRDFSLV